jgi:N-acetylglucosamine kinase-like BadF-type ATPase
MILIADSGSTKTSWLLQSPGLAPQSFGTSGINPFYQGKSSIVNSITNELLPQLNGHGAPDAVYFYGAGCSQDDRIIIVIDSLREAFPNAHIEVEHDLMAAARALCGKEAGIACILGTGSNSCLYDGVNIVDNVPSLGFIIGDEGGGGYIGRKLLQSYFYRELPDDLREMMEKRFDMERSAVLNQIYGKETPSKYVAEFAGFLTENNKHPYVHTLLYKSFMEFLTRHVLKYENFGNLPIHFTGSIAHFNKSIILEALDNLVLKPGKFMRDPIDGLAQYHAKK